MTASTSQSRVPRSTSDRPVRIISYRELHDQGFRMRRPPLVLFGLDPSGEGDDRTGFVIYERHEMELGEPIDPDYQVEHVFMMRLAERLDREIEFPEVIAMLLEYHRRMLKKPKHIAGHKFIVEVNGVGYPYASLLRKSTGPGYVIPLTTTGSTDDRSYDDDGKPRMPRMAGLDNFRVMLQLQRVMIAQGAKGGELLESEMQTFVFKGRRPEAKADAHDDLIMASAHVIWAGTRLIPPAARAERVH